MTTGAEQRHSAVTLRDLERAWNTGDLFVLDDSLHPQCVAHFPSSAEIHGPEAVKRLIAGFRDGSRMAGSSSPGRNGTAPV